MATNSGQYLTLADWAKRLDTTGKTDQIVELLDETNDMLKDIVFTEGNLPTGHKFTMRTDLPKVYFKKMNQGTPTSKSKTAQMTESTAMLEAFSEIDSAECNLNGNSKTFRMSEQAPFIEAMNQTMQETLLYGSAVNSEEFVGFMPRYSSQTAGNKQNVLSAGGSGSDNTSILLVGWGGKGCYGIFPKGTKAGLSHKDLGEELIQTTNASGQSVRMLAMVDHWIWHMGLCVKDWRYAMRIPNIDVDDLLGLSGTQAITASTSIIKRMSDALHRFPSLKGIKPCFYMNQDTLSRLDHIGLEHGKGALTIHESFDQFGTPDNEYRFRGVPIRVVNRITNSEGAVA